jgi:NTE family protein
VPKADLVLEGGGVKGLGLVGAVLHLMREGYTFPRVAGTSAGSIVAAFLAAGATADELAAIMDRLDYSRVPDRAGIPGVSESLGLVWRSGTHPGQYIHGFVRDELERLGVSTFADLKRRDGKQPYKLVVTATDITRGRLLRLPWDYRSLDLDPDEQLVADAVRASISIPLFFEPVTLRDRTLVDGGVLSNFPIEIFDRLEPRWPTFGVKVIPDAPDANALVFPGLALPQPPPVRLLARVMTTAVLGHDQTYLEQPCVRRRAIQVDTSAVGVVEFGADARKRAALVANGEQAAREFLATWDWAAYQHECRGVPKVTQRGGSARRSPAPAQQ